MPFSRASSPSILIPRRRWPPPILSPSRPSSPDPQPAIPPSSAITAPSTSHSPPSPNPFAKRCYRTVCQTTRTAQWNTGPDGLRTLCRRCYNLYYHRRIVLYQGPCGTVSAIRKAGWKPVRVTGFPVKHRAATRLMRDLTRPLVTPITGSPQDLELLRENSVAVAPGRRGGARLGKRGAAVLKGVVQKEEESIADGDDDRKRLRRTPPVDLGKMTAIVVSSESESGGNVEEEIEDGEDGEDGIGEMKEGFFVGMKRRRGRPKGCGKGGQKGLIPMSERRRNVERIFGGGQGTVAGSSSAVAKQEKDDVETTSVEAAIMAPCSRVTNAKVEDTGIDVVHARASTLVQEGGRAIMVGSGRVVQSNGGDGRRKEKKGGMGCQGKITVKVERDGDLRRLRIDTSWTLEGLREELVGMYGLVGGFSIRYRDEEGDYVTVASEKDMKELFQLVKEHNLAPLRMRVSV